MSVVGEFTVPAEAFALEHALAAVPDVVLEADQVASHSTMGVLPFLWVSRGDVDALRQAFEDDETVESVTVADELDGDVCYRMQWNDAVDDMVDRMVDHQAAIVRARASDGEWTLRLRFAEESMVSKFQAYFREQGTDFEVHSLGQLTVPRQGAVGLTTEQRTALTVAYRSGYFDIPRGTTATELGDRLGISGNAASERVRRGCRTLVESSLSLEAADGER